MRATGPQLEPTAEGRLGVRRPALADLDAVFRIHSDPRTNTHNPTGPDRGRDASRERLREWIEHWERYGFGYWVVETLAPAGGVVGFTGVRHSTWLGEQVLNLYYRYAPQVWGQGYAAEGARHAVSWARTRFPAIPVHAYTTVGNVASQRTALAAGLVRRPDLEGEHDGIHAVVFVSHWPATDL